MKWIKAVTPPGVAALVAVNLAVIPLSDAAEPEQRDKASTHRVVTLISGDRVVLGPEGSTHVEVLPGPGREKMRFSLQRAGDRVRVTPADAEQLVAAGAVDDQLFDVTGLLEQRYGDSDRNDLPVLVESATGNRSLSNVPGAKVLANLPTVRSLAVRVDKGDGGLWRAVTGNAVSKRQLGAGVARLWLDRRLTATIDRSALQIGAPAAWDRGLTGRNVKVAVLDTGVDSTHPDLAGRVAASANFSGAPDHLDRHGHGTHVAGTIAGNGTASGGRYRGMAPDATLLNGKVLDDRGSGTLSSVIAGMEWAVAQGADIVNMSLGDSDTPELDPVEQAVNTLTAAHGTLFVVAAGNSRQPDEGSVGSPATADEALAVGAVDRQDAIASFSNRGPRLGDAGIKPEITAPGVDISAARSTTSSGNGGQSYFAASGTSMATPHVAGAAAVLAQQHPGWSPRQLKSVLMAAANPADKIPAFTQGAGRVDVARAIGQGVVAEPASLGFGIIRWPHTERPPTTRTLTYRNLSDHDVTLGMSVRATGPGGTTAPAGMFTLSAQELVVPAGGIRTVGVTAHAPAGTADGSYSGHVIASDGKNRVVTPIGIVREPESYDLEISAKDLGGTATANFVVDLFRYDKHWSKSNLTPASGVLRIRLPRGEYSLEAKVYEESGLIVQIMQPWLLMTRNRTVALDSRTARPIDMRVERKDAALAAGFVGFASLITDDGGAIPKGYATAMLFGEFAGVRTAQVGPDAPADRFAGAVHAIFGVRGPGGMFQNTPYTYNLGYFTPGKAYTGAKTIRDKDLAIVRSRYLAQGNADKADMASAAYSTRLDGAPIPGTRSIPLSLPGGRTEMFTTEGVAWQRVMRQNPPEPPNSAADAWQIAPWREYRSGKRTEETWNGAAVLGPSLPGPPLVATWANQFPGALNIAVPLFGTGDDVAGLSKVVSARTVISRDGTTICESATAGSCSAPGTPRAGRFRVETDAVRNLGDVSTRVMAVWQFRHDGSSNPVTAPALPVQVVRFAPALDEANSAPAGRTLVVPVTVQRNPGAPKAGLASLTVEVSYDDGRHWQRVRVDGGLSRAKLVLKHPAPGYVSLRARAVDTAGNSVEQTIVRAYRLR